jgi:uncharacterized membrane protein
MASQRPAGGGRQGGSRQASGRQGSGRQGSGRQGSGARPAGGGAAGGGAAGGGRPAGGRPAGGGAKAAGRVPVSKAPAGQASVRPAAAGRGPAAGASASKPPPGLPDAPNWLRWSTLILSVLGLGVSIYLTVEHYTTNTLAGCSETSGAVNCTKVTTSAQSVVFGIFPVAVLGLAFFVFMVAANSPWAWNWKLPAFRWLRLASVVVGIGFVLYLVYTELFQIQAICLYCTSVHVITFLLFAIIVFDSTFRHAPAPAPTLQRR